MKTNDKSMMLLLRLEELEKNWDKFDFPNGEFDETIKWILEPLSDEARAHIFNSVYSVIKAYQNYKIYEQ